MLAFAPITTSTVHDTCPFLLSDDADSASDGPAVEFEADMLVLHAQQIELNQVRQRVKELEKVIADLLACQSELQAKATRDPLTGLANRQLLQDRFVGARQRAKRLGGWFALLMIDLDGFKAINDIHGHAAGDDVLVAVAQRLSAALRSCDTVARVGGDEFVLIVECLSDPAEILPIGRKLITGLLAPIELRDGAQVAVGASVGLALYPDDGQTLADMMDVADHAMYENKAVSRLSGSV